MNIRSTTKRHATPAAAAPAGERYIGRVAALQLLGVKPQTLYAYVSRGWIRSVQAPGGGRSSLYAREDVEKVKARASARAGHGVAAAGAMRWGEPIIPTAITEIRADGPYYRGRSAIELARSGRSFEAVAELLWSGRLPEEDVRWPPPALPAPIGLPEQPPRAAGDGHIIEALAVLTLRLGMSRGTLKARLANASPLEAGRQLMQAYAAALGLLGPQRSLAPMQEPMPLAEAMLRALGVTATPAASSALDALLIALADHELTSSTFAARVAASAGATLHGCVAAAMATASGLEIGRLYDRVNEFLDGSATADGWYDASRSLQAHGQTPPGFNHPMYPRGDPRAELLIEIAEALPGRRSRGVGELRSFAERARGKLHLHPRVEFGVVVLCRALKLPAASAGALFAIARTAGTVAHVIEQRSAGFLLRPRARFVGASG